MSAIGTLNEGSLHAALKDLYLQPGDRVEVPLDRFVIDIWRDDLLIEIQTGAFGAMGSKLDRLLPEHKLLLVYPIAAETVLQRPNGKTRRSPKRGSIYNLFDELIAIPTLLDHPNLSLEVVLVSTTKVQVHDPKARRGRGGYRTVDRELDEVHEHYRFEDVYDLAGLVPTGLPELFTTADLAHAASISRNLAQRMAYCLRRLNIFEANNRTRAGIGYTLA